MTAILRGVWRVLRTALRVPVLLSALAIAYLATDGGRALWRHVDHQLRVQAETHLQQLAPRLKVSIGSAERLGGRGVRLRQLEIREPDGRPLLEIDQVDIDCQSELDDLARCELDVRQAVLRGLRLHVRRSPQGCNLTQLAPLFHNCGAGGRGEPPVRIEEGELLLTPAAATQPALRISQIQLSLQPADDDVPAEALPIAAAPPIRRKLAVALSADFRGAPLTLQAVLAPSDQQWFVKLEMPRLPVDSSLLAALRHWGAPIRLAATARGELHNIYATLSGQGTQLQRHRLLGRLTAGRWDEARLPYPVSDVSADLSIDEQIWEARNVRARTGGAQWSSRQLRWMPAQQRLEIAAIARDLPVQENWIRRLPQAWQNAAQRHELGGRLDEARIQLIAVAGRTAAISVDTHFSRLQFRCPPTPTRIRDARGRIQWDGRQLLVDLIAPVRGAPVHMTAQLQPLAPAAPVGWMEIDARETFVPIDEELLAVLPPDSLDAVRRMNPRGACKAWWRWERPDAHSPESTRAHVELAHGAVSPVDFPYPIEEIQGHVAIDDNGWICDLQGQNSHASITCQGGWSSPPAGPPRCALKLQAHNLALDDELRDALTPDGRRLWSALQPAGRLDQLDLQLDYDIAACEWRSAITAVQDLRPRNSGGISLRPRSLAFSLDQLSGRFEYRDGLFQFSDARAERGESVVRAEGGMQWAGRQWTLRLAQLDARQWRLDRGTLGALGASLQPGLKGQEFGGTVDLQLQGAFSGVTAPDVAPALHAANWSGQLQLQDLSIGRWLTKQPVRPLRGELTFEGRHSPNSSSINGEARLETLGFLDRTWTVTSLQGPWQWRLADNRLRFGAWASATQRPRQIEGEFLGGQLRFDAEVGLGVDDSMALAATLQDARLKGARLKDARLKDARPPSTGGAPRGSVSGILKLTGSRRDTARLRGQGMAQLRDADVYETPLAMALLQMVASGGTRPAERTLFTQGDVDFRIQGEQLLLDRIRLDGGALSLQGEGTMNLQQELQLTLKTVGLDQPRGPHPLAIVRPWLGEASRRIMEIEVAGTVDRPEITRRALPELNNTLQRMLRQDPPRAAAAQAERARR